MKKIAILLVFALWTVSLFASPGKEGPKQTLWAKVTLHVDWNKRNENSGELINGVMNLSMSGTLTLNRDFSGDVAKGRFSPLLSYALQSSTFDYNYREDWSINRQDNPPKCPNPQRSMHKTGSASGDQGGMPMNLIIHYHKGLAEGASRLPIALPPEAKDALIDYYEFVVLVPAQKSEGKSKVADSKFGGCKEIDQSDPILDGQIDIAFRIGPDGKLSGSKSWSSQALSHNFSVKVSDLPESFKKKPAVPTPHGKNDVHYSLTWDLDAAPVAQIEHETGGYWFDITGIDQDVIVGQKVKLKGLVAPRSMDSESGEWTIGNEGTVKPIKKFEASTDAGEVISLPSEDLKKKELMFYFTGEGESEVTYKTKAGDEDVTAKVKFKVKKPAFDLQVEATGSNTYGPLEFGEANSSDQCCLGELSPAEDDLIRQCREAKKDMDTNPIDKRFYETRCIVRGLQYNGITFTACPRDDTKGKIQFVQLVSRVDTRRSAFGGSQSQSTPQGLDGCYPYPPISEYQAKDMPGFSDPDDSASLTKEFIYTTVLMFKPEGEDNEWVPLKLVDWSWKGGIICAGGSCQEDPGARSFPHSTAGQDAKEYPKWNHCSQTGR